MADLGYYETLGVQPASSQDDIAQAFRRLAREDHPDVNAGDPDAAARFKRVTEAYHVLSDPALRAHYDLERANNASGQAAPEQSAEERHEGQPFVVQRSVRVNSAEVESALGDLRTALTDAASAAANDLRGALRDFAAELDTQINALSRAASSPDRSRRMKRFPPPPPRRSAPPRRR